MKRRWNVSGKPRTFIILIAIAIVLLAFIACIAWDVSLFLSQTRSSDVHNHTMESDPTTAPAPQPSDTTPSFQGQLWSMPLTPECFATWGFGGASSDSRDGLTSLTYYIGEGYVTEHAEYVPAKPDARNILSTSMLTGSVFTVRWWFKNAGSYGDTTTYSIKDLTAQSVTIALDSDQSSIDYPEGQHTTCTLQRVG